MPTCNSTGAGPSIESGGAAQHGYGETTLPTGHYREAGASSQHAVDP